MTPDLNIDKLDLQIIQQLIHDAGLSYAEMGKKLFVSAGTIHVPAAYECPSESNGDADR